MAAYDDRDGVTAAFKLNMLRRLNRELGADFELACYRHRALWNSEESRIEMHLESRCDQRVRISVATLTFISRNTKPSILRTATSSRIRPFAPFSNEPILRWSKAGRMSRDGMPLPLHEPDNDLGPKLAKFEPQADQAFGT